MSLTLLTNIICDYLREFSKKFETIPIGYSEARGTLIFEKNMKSKISCQTPFNVEIGTEAAQSFSGNTKIGFSVQCEQKASIKKSPWSFPAFLQTLTQKDYWMN